MSIPRSSTLNHRSSSKGNPHYIDFLAVSFIEMSPYQQELIVQSFCDKAALYQPGSVYSSSATGHGDGVTAPVQHSTPYHEDIGCVTLEGAGYDIKKRQLFDVKYRRKRPLGMDRSRVTIPPCQLNDLNFSPIQPVISSNIENEFQHDVATSTSEISSSSVKCSDKMERVYKNLVEPCPVNPQLKHPSQKVPVDLNPILIDNSMDKFLVELDNLSFSKYLRRDINNTMQPKNEKITDDDSTQHAYRFDKIRKQLFPSVQGIKHDSYKALATHGIQMHVMGFTISSPFDNLTFKYSCLFRF